MMVPDSVLSMTVLRAVEWYNRVAVDTEARVYVVEGSRIHIYIEGGCEECGVEALVAGLLEAFIVSGLDAVVEDIIEGDDGYTIIVRVTPRPPLTAS